MGALTALSQPSPNLSSQKCWNALCFAVGSADCFALVRVVVDEAELLTIATHPARQRRGLARACMHDWMSAAARRGADMAHLEVAADNAAAIALYESCGFRAVGRRAGYYRRGANPAVDAVLMHRRLDHP